LARIMPLDYKLAFAWCQNSNGLWDAAGARKVLIPLVAADPDDRVSRVALATNFSLAGLFDDAEATLRPLPDSDPDACALRARMALDRGEIDRAERLAQSGPADHPRLNALRGRLALHHGNASEAAAFFQASLRQEPENRDAIHGLGVALEKLGDPQAKVFLKMTARRDELKQIIVTCGTKTAVDAKVLPRLAELCESLGRSDQARMWYQIALDVNPNDYQSQEALARLQRADAHTDANVDSQPHDSQSGR
jgi:tetratricopeptide (TPR) repeat protein